MPDAERVAAELAKAESMDDFFGVEISAQSISTIADKVWSLVEAWQSQPLNAI